MMLKRVFVMLFSILVVGTRAYERTKIEDPYRGLPLGTLALQKTRGDSLPLTII